MRDKDIKILWGRSGNRCAICKIELTPDRALTTLGEMAHIVAHSLDGPRGKEQLAPDQRDEYPNLILLCPTHHTEIDKNPQKWTCEKLLRIKTDHEKWVSTQLEEGRITVQPVDNSDFIEARIEFWKEFSQQRLWIASSITPLRVNNESINPLESQIVRVLNKVRLPSEIPGNGVVNSSRTHPNEHGLINDDLDRINDGDGHSIQVFRNGHCEYLFCLESSVNAITQYAHQRDPQRIGLYRVIRYTTLAETLAKQVSWLKHIWENCLSFKDMSLNCVILNTSNCRLYSREINFIGAMYGFPIQSPYLHYTDVAHRDKNIQELLENILKRIVNYFGLILDRVYDDKGDYQRPKRMAYEQPGT
jgi:hypothetical protein